MKILTNSKRGGFTLIELLVVIAIIGLLTGIVVANLTTSRAKARDAKRISDVGQMQLALELYFDRCNRYPAADSGSIDINDSCPVSSGGPVDMQTFISKIPTPPQTDLYEYFVETSNNADYVLRATLEGYNEALKDSLTDSDVEACNNSDTPSGRQYCVGPN